MNAQEFVPNELIVQLQDNATPIDLINKFKSIELSFKSKISNSLNLFCFKYSSKKIESKAAMNLIKDCSLVKLVQNNHYVVFNSVPNDVLYPQQWAMQTIQAPDAWNINTGGNTVQNDEIVIAVLDKGFDLQHGEINYWTNSAEIPNNGIDDDLNDIIDDYHGYNAFDNNNVMPLNGSHGTIIAGIIGAKGNNSIGVTGVNWDVKIMPIAAASQTEEVVLRGYDYVLEMRRLYNQSNGTQGAFIVATNASFSTPSSANAIPENYTAWCQIYDELGAEGVLNVNAPINTSHEIGSQNNNNEIPATCESEFLLVVTATNQNDELHDLSPWSDEYVDIAAPGVDILSTSPGGGYVIDEFESTGTSVAAPFVSGAISLLYANACNEFLQNYKANPSLYALEVRDLIFNWSDPISALLGKAKFGRLNLYRSLAKMKEQFDSELTISGIESETRNYEAINSIDVTNYYSTPQFDINMRSGGQINFSGETTLSAGNGKCFNAIIDIPSFDCAIPFEPLTVDLLAPETSMCNFLGVTCNAIPYGGKPPYNFIWKARSINESEFNIFSPNTPNMLFTYEEDFYVQVEVTDDRGVTVISDIEFINCLLQRIGRDSDPLAESNYNIMIYNENLPSQSDKSHFVIYPNPSSSLITVSARLTKKNDLTILLYDVTGKLIAELLSKKHFESGIYEKTFDISAYENGIYFISILSDKGIRNYKLVKSE